MQSARTAEDATQRRELYTQAAKYYADAARSHFKDDEKHAYFLKIALDAHWLRGDPLKITLPLCASIRSAITEMKKIWECSTDAMSLQPQFDVVLAFEAEFKRRLAEGKASLDDIACPDYAVRVCLDYLVLFL
jgi:hypothetical protein